MKEEFVKRLEEEVQDLKQKLTKLSDFMETEDFMYLTKVERFLLEDQFDSMEHYLYILQARSSLYTEFK